MSNPVSSLVAAAAALAKDLVNTPANDMGPRQSETVAQEIAEAHGASLSVVVGEALLDGNCPAVHAVGRAAAPEGGEGAAGGARAGRGVRGWARGHAGPAGWPRLPAMSAEVSPFSSRSAGSAPAASSWRTTAGRL